MANLGATLGKQIGPLPLGAWIAVVGGGLGIAYYAQRKQGAEPSAEDQTQLAETGVGEGTAAFIPAAEVTSPQPDVETFDEWVNKAIKQAGAIGYSPLTIEQALRLYGKGEKLTDIQAKIVNRVIELIGPAPAGEITEPPILPTPTTPTTTHKYTFNMAAAPTRYRNGRSVTFRGTLLDNGQPLGLRAIRVYRRHLSSQRWGFYKLASTNGSGVFAFTASEPTRGATSYGIRITYGGAARNFALRQIS